MTPLDWFKKEKPLMGLLGSGGGLAQGAKLPLPFALRYFITAGGGGGGGGQGAGGGGAGAIRVVADATPYVTVDTPYPIQLGARGDGSGPSGPTPGEGADGGNSYFTGPTINAGGGGGGGASNSNTQRAGRNGIQVGGSGGGGGNNGASTPDSLGVGEGGQGYDFAGQPEINDRGPGGPFDASSGGQGFSGPGTYSGNRGGGGGGVCSPTSGTGGDGKPANNGNGAQPPNPTGRPAGPGGHGIVMPTDYLPDGFTSAGPNVHFTPSDPSNYRGWSPGHTWGYFLGVNINSPSPMRRKFGGGGGGGTEKVPVRGGWADYQEGVGGIYRGGVGGGGANSDYPQNSPTNLSGQAWPDGGTWGFAGGGGGGAAPPTGDQGADGGGGVVIFKVPNGHTVSSPLLTDPGNQIFADPEGDNRLIMFVNNTYSDITTTITFTEG